MRKFHVALSVSNLDLSIQDYSSRLGLKPEVVIPNEYALWRTDVLNFSIRKVDDGSAGTLRHVGWEDDAAAQFNKDTDVNGIPWERFTAAQQKAEIAQIWPAKRHN